MTPPSVSFDKSGWYQTPTTVTILATDPESGIASIRSAWGNVDACTSGTPVSGPIDVLVGAGQLHTLKVCVRNGAGLQALAEAQLGVDETPALVSTDKSGWYPAAGTVTATATDAESGIASLRSAWDDASAACTGTPVTAPLALLNGTHTLYLCATNGAGHTTQLSVPLGIDTTPPMLSIDRSGWYVAPTNVTVTSADPESAIVSTKFVWDNGSACTSGTPVSDPIPIPRGAHTLFVCAVNGAGTGGTLSQRMGFDDTPPTVSIGKTGWVTIATTTTPVTVGDVESGIAVKKYLYDVDDACAAGASFTTTVPTVPSTRYEPRELYVCAINGAGLTATAHTPLTRDSLVVDDFDVSNDGAFVEVGIVASNVIGARITLADGGINRLVAFENDAGTFIVNTIRTARARATGQWAVLLPVQSLTSTTHWVRLYDANGTPLTAGEFLPGSQQTEFKAIAMTDFGDWAVVWATFAGPATTGHLWLRNAVGGERAPAGAFGPCDYAHHVAMNPLTGGGVVTCQKNDQTVHYRRFEADGGWLDSSLVQVPGAQAAAYDFHGVGMNSSSSFAIKASKIGASTISVFDPSGSLVQTTSVAGGLGTYAFVTRNIQTLGDDFIVPWGDTNGLLTSYYRMSPDGGVVSSASVDPFELQHLAIDGHGTPWVMTNGAQPVVNKAPFTFP